MFDWSLLRSHPLARQPSFWAVLWALDRLLVAISSLIKLSEAPSGSPRRCNRHPHLGLLGVPRWSTGPNAGAATPCCMYRTARWAGEVRMRNEPSRMLGQAGQRWRNLQRAGAQQSPARLAGVLVSAEAAQSL